MMPVRAAAILILTACCSSGAQTSASARADYSPRPPTTPDDGRVDEGVFWEIDLQLGTTGPRFEALGGARRFEAFVDSRVDQPAAYETLLPLLFAIARPRDVTLVPLVLEKRSRAGQDYYFLPDDGDCGGRGLERTAPWWNRSAVVAICPKSHRPDLDSDTAGGSFHYCESVDRRPITTRCRCGPNLVNCVRDHEMAGALIESLRAEVVFSLRDAIAGNRAFGGSLSGNATVQPPLAVRMYERNEFLRTRKWPDDPAAPDRPVERPRPEHYQGGILSAPWITFYDEAPRITVATLWEDFLCVPLSSTSVNARDVIHEASDPQLRHVGHMALVTKRGCTNCHARIEHGMLAFSEFTTSRVGLRYIPKPQPQTMRFFLRDLRSERGSGPADLAYLGEMFRTQPEFAACVVDRVLAAIHRGDDVGRDVRGRLLAEFVRTQDFKQLLRGAIHARHAPAREN